MRWSKLLKQKWIARLSAVHFPMMDWSFHQRARLVPVVAEGEEEPGIHRHRCRTRSNCPNRLEEEVGAEEEATSNSIRPFPNPNRQKYPPEAVVAAEAEVGEASASRPHSIRHRNSDLPIRPAEAGAGVVGRQGC